MRQKSVAKRKAPVRPPAAPASVVRQLAALYRQKGYVRRQDSKRVQKEGHQAYKKGDELRMVAATKKDLALIRRLLKQAGFKVGRAFEKANQFAQPIYGKQQVARFLKLVRKR